MHSCPVSPKPLNAACADVHCVVRVIAPSALSLAGLTQQCLSVKQLSKDSIIFLVLQVEPDSSPQSQLRPTYSKGSCGRVLRLASGHMWEPGCMPTRAGLGWLQQICV